MEKAINNLKDKNYLSPGSLRSLPPSRLASLIKPAGYFNIKTKRLKHFMAFFYEEYQGNLRKMAKEDLSVLRRKLLGVNGIGPETADSILLYAVDKPVFVVDAYTRRILSRHNIINHKMDYHEVQDIFMNSLDHDVALFNEYHALIVQIGKIFCRPKPQCEECPLKRFLPLDKQNSVR